MAVYVLRSVCLLVMLVAFSYSQITDGLKSEQDVLFKNDKSLIKEIEDVVDNETEDLPLDVSNNLDLILQKDVTVDTKAWTFINDSINNSQNEDQSKRFEQVFATSFFVTTMSEFGDKTFFLSAIMAMRHSRTLTFIGSTIAQTIMTLISVIFGMAASLIPQTYTQWASAVIMTFFGLKMLKESTEMDDSVDNLELHEDEYEKSKTLKSEEVAHDENDNLDAAKGNTEVTDKTMQDKPKDAAKPPDYNTGVLIQALTLCLMGEWGDKSQIATILLASNEDPYAVATGGIFGHILCNAVAVFGGRMLASKFPVKTVTQVGGVFFLLAAVSTVIFD